MKMKTKDLNILWCAVGLLAMMFGTVTIYAQTTAQITFINSERATMRSNLPATEGILEFFGVSTLCPAGCDRVWNSIFLEVKARTPNHTVNTLSPADTQTGVRPTLLSDYCSGDFPSNRIPVFIDIEDNTGAFIDRIIMNPSDCPTPVKPTPAPTPVPKPLSPNSSFLNSWSADIRKKLPLTAGDFNLLETESNCPNGCENVDSSEFLVIFAKTPLLTLGSITLAQLEARLKPAMTTEYCGSGGHIRNIPMTIFLRDKNDTPYGNFWINSIDCSNAGTVTPTTNPTPRPTPITVSSPTPGTVAGTGGTVEEQFWDAVKNSNRIADLESYKTSFPSGKFHPLANLRIRQLGGIPSGTPSPGPVTPTPNPVTTITSGATVEDQFWDAVKNSKNRSDLESYKTNYPNGKYIALANLAISKLPANKPVVPTPTTPTSGGSVEDQFWDAVKDSKNVSDLQSYKTNYPNGKYVALATLKISQIGNNPAGPVVPTSGQTVEDQVWALVDDTRKKDFEQYLRDFPNGKYAPLAQLGAIRADEKYWNKISVSPATHTFQGYLNDYPSGKFAALARLKIQQGASNPGTVLPNPALSEDNLWNSVKSSNNAADFNRYLISFPNGKYSALARLRISQLGGQTTPITNNPVFPTSINKMADILSKAQVGSESELRGKRSFWVITEGNDFDSKKIITDEMTDPKDGLPNSSAARREDDADIIILFRLTNEKTGALVNSRSNVNDQTHVGEMIAYTSTKATNGQPVFRVLFRTTKKQFFSATGGTWNRHPATNAVRELIKKMN